MFRGIISLFAALGSIVSNVLSKHGRYIPGLDELVDIAKQVGPILATSEHPDAPQLAMRLNKVLNKE